jgi:phosphatidylglycerophosphate synthase
MLPGPSQRDAGKGFAGVYRAVLDSYYRQVKEQTERRFVFYRFVYRPLSFPLSALAIRLGVSANAVTLLSLGILAASFVALGFGGGEGLLAGAALYFAYYVLDFADGNIARYHGQPSFFGKLIDGMVDTLSFLIFAFAALGNVRAGLSALPGDAEIFLGIAATIAALLRQNYRWRLAYLRAEMGLTIAAPAPQNEEAQAGQPRVPAAAWLFDNLATSAPLLLAAAALAQLVSFFVLAFFLLYAIGGTIETVYSILKNRAALQQRRAH